MSVVWHSFVLCILFRNIVRTISGNIKNAYCHRNIIHTLKRPLFECDHSLNQKRLQSFVDIFLQKSSVMFSCTLYFERF